MDKPLYEFKEFGRRIHQLISRVASKRGIAFMAGPQGQVLRIISERDKAGQKTLVKDIEQELHISKSVASNLVKRMEKNELLTIEVSQEDRRAKHLLLTESSRVQFKKNDAFFDEVEDCMMAGVSEEDYQTFVRVMNQFYSNMENMKGEEEDVSNL